MIEDPANDVEVSPASYWEIAIKISLRKFSPPQPYQQFMESQIATTSFAFCTLNPSTRTWSRLCRSITKTRLTGFWWHKQLWKASPSSAWMNSLTPTACRGSGKPMGNDSQPIGSSTKVRDRDPRHLPPPPAVGHHVPMVVVDRMGGAGGEAAL